MSHVKALAIVVSVGLAAGMAMAQQAGQGSSQQGMSQQGSSQQGMSQQGASEQGSSQQGWQGRSQSSGAGGSMTGSQDIQQLSQWVSKDKANLQTCISKASSQVKNGQIIGAAFVQEQAGDTSGEQGLTAHVFVVSNNELQDVVVDPKTHKVQATNPEQAISNPWQMSAGTAGQDGMQGQATGQQLTQSTAQDISQLARQDSVDLRKVISKADSQVKGNVVGAFLVLPSQTSMGMKQQSSGQKGSAFAKVYIVDKNNQLQIVTVDAKTDKVINMETQQSLGSPWQGRFSTGMGSGSSGSSSGSSSGGSSSGSTSGMPQSGQDQPSSPRQGGSGY